MAKKWLKSETCKLYLKTSNLQSDQSTNQQKPLLPNLKAKKRFLENQPTSVDHQKLHSHHIKANK